MGEFRGVRCAREGEFLATFRRDIAEVEMHLEEESKAKVVVKEAAVSKRILAGRALSQDGGELGECEEMIVCFPQRRAFRRTFWMR